jgi:hypothetical protein
VLRLLDAQGRELAFCDDESGLSGDCRVAHVFAAGGDYFIEVRDINYGGGADYRFRLRVGDFPLVNLPFPAGVKAGSPGTFTFVGPQVDKVPTVTATAAVDELRLPLAAKFPGGKSSAFGALHAPGRVERTLPEGQGTGLLEVHREEGTARGVHRADPQPGLAERGDAATPRCQGHRADQLGGE